ncbi:MAG: hypothetical protein KGQ38_03175 [Actinomycetales bacterium]|nr:hypothetical protein [Actinomycetales bacterium]
MENNQNPQQISLVKVPNLKEMTPDELREWAEQLHAKLVAKLGQPQPGDSEKPDNSEGPIVQVKTDNPDTQDRQSPAN